MGFVNAVRGYLEGMREHPSVVVGDEARSIHENSLVVDLHNDIMLHNALYGFKMNKRHAAPRYFNPLRPLTDIPRLGEGGVTGLGMGIATLPFMNAKGSKLRWMFRMLDAMDRAVRTSAGKLTLVEGAGDIMDAKRRDKIALIPGLEGLHIIEGDISVLKDLKDRGLCYVTMAHFKSNEAAISNYDKKPRFSGLSEFGREVLMEMKELDLIVDLAHTATSTLLEVVDSVKEPVIVSHTNCHSLFPLWRNVTDEEIKAVAERDGVIGIMVSPRFTSNNYCAPLSLVIDHIGHVVDIAGARHAAIGSDIDGFVPTPNGFWDVSNFPKITQLLLDRGFSFQEIQGILGKNFLRVFGKVIGE